MEYSGIVKPGWTASGSYDRLQYKGVMTSTSEITDFINDEALNRFESEERSRLDLRLEVDMNRDQLNQLHDLFPTLEISAFFNPNNFRQVQEIVICSNKLEREVPAFAMTKMQEHVRSKTQRTITNLSEKSIAWLDCLAQKQYQFETKKFTAQELVNLWGNTFGWSLQQCQRYVDNGIPNEKIYGMRNTNGQLCAAMLVSHGESTEWAVCPQSQGQGLISPLLMYSHVHWVQDRANEVLQVFARFDRSVAPALRTGFIQYENQRPQILTNHVTVSKNEAADHWNQNLTQFGNTNGQHLRSFSVGQLNPEHITTQVQDNYLEFAQK